LETKLEGIALSHTDYGESDRMVNVLTPEQGLVSFAARGVRKPKAKLALATEQFVTGRYTLSQKSERKLLIGFELIEGFYPLRLEYERLCAANCAAAFCALFARENMPETDMYPLLVRTVGYLAYTSRPILEILCAFAAELARIEGLYPTFDTCAVCGQTVRQSDAMRFSASDGGACHARCAPGAKPLSSNLWVAMQSDASGALAGACLLLWSAHFAHHLDGKPKAILELDKLNHAIAYENT